MSGVGSEASRILTLQSRPDGDRTTPQISQALHMTTWVTVLSASVTEGANTPRCRHNQATNRQEPQAMEAPPPPKLCPNLCTTCAKLRLWYLWFVVNPNARGWRLWVALVLRSHAKIQEVGRRVAPSSRAVAPSTSASMTFVHPPIQHESVLPLQ